MEPDVQPFRAPDEYREACAAAGLALLEVANGSRGRAAQHAALAIKVLPGDQQSPQPVDALSHSARMIAAADVFPYSATDWSITEAPIRIAAGALAAVAALGRAAFGRA